MVTRLPVELVEQVVHTLSALPQDSRVLRIRQKTLSGLCRVSQSFYFMARPLLYDTVLVETEDQADSLYWSLHGDQSLAELPRMLIAERSLDPLDDWDEFEQETPDLLRGHTVLTLAKTLPRLQRVVFQQYSDLTGEDLDVDLDARIVINFSAQPGPFGGACASTRPSLSFPHHVPLPTPARVLRDPRTRND